MKRTLPLLATLFLAPAATAAEDAGRAADAGTPTATDAGTGTATATDDGGTATVAGPEPASADLLPRELWPEMEIATAPREGLTVGDVVTLTITADAREGDDVAVPRQTFEPFEVHSTDLREEARGGGKRFVFTIELLAFEPGTHTVGPVRLRVVTADGTIGRVETEPVEVTIASLLGNEPDAQPKPDTRPVQVMEEDYTLAWIGGGLAAVLLVALLGFLFARWWMRRERPLPPPAPPRPAWEVAMESLEALRRSLPERIVSSTMDVWADQLSDTVRAYLGDRYDFDGLESTTDEVVARMRKLSPRGVSVDEVAAILGDCDLVKFAKATAEQDQSERMLESVRAMVQRTRPSFAEREEGVAPATATPQGGTA